MKAYVNSLLLMTILLSLISNAYNNEFSIILKSKSKQCFTEFIEKGTFFRVDIKTEIYMINLEVQLPGEPLLLFNNSSSFKRSFTTLETGEFSICMNSFTKNDQRINIKLVTGVAAKDFSEIVKESDLKPINEKIEMIEKKVRDFKLSTHHAQENQNNYMSLKEELGGFITFWFLMLSGIMIVLGLIGYTYTYFTINTYKIK